MKRQKLPTKRHGELMSRYPIGEEIGLSTALTVQPVFVLVHRPVWWVCKPNYWQKQIRLIALRHNVFPVSP